MKFLMIALMLFSLNCFAEFGNQNFTLLNQLYLTANTTSTKILSQDTRRSYLLIQNTGSTSVFVKIQFPQTGVQGIEVPAGGNWEPVTPPLSDIYVRTSSGTNTITVIDGY